jgi:hypothetical protein
MNTVSEREKMAVEAVSELTKQLISLATGVTTVTVAFAKDVFNSPVGGAGRCWRRGSFISSPSCRAYGC